MPGAAYIFRGGTAIGDCLFMSAMPRLLAEQGYRVTLGIKESNQEVFTNNPHINAIEFLPDKADRGDDWMANWLKNEKPKYTRLINTSSHVEAAYLMRTDLEYGMFPKIEEMRERALGKNYYDEMYRNCGFEVTGILPEIYLSEAEKEIIRQNQEQKQGRKLVLWQLQGSTRSKTLVKAPEWIAWALREYPDSVHYVWCSDINLAKTLPKGSKNLWGQTSIRETLRLIASADLVLGPESFMVNAAPAFGVPTVIFFSHSLPDNLSRYYPRSTAITPNCECHPCYLICINFRRLFDPWQRRIAREVERGCLIADPDYEYRKLGYRCCLEIDDEQVYEGLREGLEI